MDSALLLRKYYDQKRELTGKEIDDLLTESKLVSKLTSDYEDKALFHIFRILCLAEIPYVEKLPYTQKIIEYISKRLALPDGFSYTGTTANIVPCYNAMLLEAYTRLGLSHSKEVANALTWIKKYQVFERNQSTSWSYDGICKHGGCMRSTPCYIGIGKTVKALITYAEYSDGKDQEVEQLIQLGVSYMLKHHLFQRLSNQKPISKHITDNMVPQAYMLSLTDLVFICNKRNLWDDSKTNPLKELLKEKQINNTSWRIDYIYTHKGYKPFETKRNNSEWLDYLYEPVKNEL